MFLLSSAYSVLVTMADEDPLAAAWRCCVPVRISLASNEIASNDVPGSMPVPPIYVLAPRHSYIHTLAGYAWPLVQHVLVSLPGQTSTQPWLEFNQLPLKGHLPVGVLYDLLVDLGQANSYSYSSNAASHPPVSTGSSAAASSSSTESSKEPVAHHGSSHSSEAQGTGSSNPEAAVSMAATISAAPQASASLQPQPTAVPHPPWELTLHFRSPPAETQVPWLNQQPLKAQFLNSLKEACYICKGPQGSGAVMRMDSGDQDSMWAASEKGDLPTYRGVMSRVKVIPSERSHGQPASIPVRVLIRLNSNGSSPGDPHFWDTSVISSSRPIPALTPSGDWVTLESVLGMLLAALAPGNRPAAAKGGQMQSSMMMSESIASLAPAQGSAATQPEQGAAAHQPDSHRDAAGGAGSLWQAGNWLVFIGGMIDPPLETPLAWLHAHAHSPDYFLYLVLRQL